jgi:hypothetical protein
VRLEGLGKLKKIHLIGTRTRNRPTCSIVPQPTTLPRTPFLSGIRLKYDVVRTNAHGGKREHLSYNLVFVSLQFSLLWTMMPQIFQTRIKTWPYFPCRYLSTHINCSLPTQWDESTSCFHYSCAESTRFCYKFSASFSLHNSVEQRSYFRELSWQRTWFISTRLLCPGEFPPLLLYAAQNDCGVDLLSLLSRKRSISAQS